MTIDNGQKNSISDAMRNRAQAPTDSVLSRAAVAESQDQEMQARWNETDADFPQACAHELFEEQAARSPLAIAVVGRGKSLTYRDLNGRANQVANYLRKQGVGPGDLVGVCLERCPELVSALFGVWKAGGAYVPLDPSYPQERLSFMVNDASIRTVLTEQKHKQMFSSLGERAICMDEDWQAIAQENSTDLDHCTTPSDLAYVMYTSGSTGKPKGAMIHHCGLVNYLWWAIGQYKVRSGGSVPVHSSISFDLTVTSLYPALLTGGQVELLGEDVGALNLLAALRETKHRNLVKITPAHLETLSQQLSGREMAGLTDLFVIGGENLQAENLRVWRESAPRTRLINEYGPTETVVGCCVYEVRPEDPHNGPVPIGRPIANMRMYILDENLLPQAPGVMGEIYIGGVGVARGYLNREELTRERFLKDPFSSDKEARMYRTGDLGRYRQDGIIEYLGRTDNQVKVRGYRIELGEIEAALASWPRAQSCVVLAREDVPGDKQLVGYLVLRESEKPQTDDLLAFLKNRLPEYMVPARLVFLDSFPLTPNGKIDRKALPAPSEDTARAKEIIAPSDPLEHMLVGIWAKILKVKQISVTDDFFDLGGHSLLAVRVSTEVERLCHIRLPLAILFETPTVAALAEYLRKQNWAPSWSSLVPIRSRGSRPPLFLMHSHGGNTLEYHALANLLDADQPVYALQARGLDGHIRSNSTVEEMATAYLEEIRSIQPEGPYYLGGFCLGGLLALEAAQQLRAAGEEVPLVTMIQSIHPQFLGFRPGTALPYRLWYRTTKRVDLELENLSHRGMKYLVERSEFVLRSLPPKVAVALGRVKVNGNTDLSHLPTRYILEVLSVEHSNALKRYVPRTYNGKVLLFRASEQLRGLAVEEDLGWGNVLRGNLEICEIRGHQQNLLLRPNVIKLAEELNSRLAATHKISDTA